MKTKMEQLDLFTLKPVPLVLKGGYAGRPGWGPEGETCKTCEYYTLVKHHDYTYRKCWLIKTNWTNGKGTDIKASAPVCQFWESGND
ncbi:MAG: hypothetical protein BWK78_04750 [Thiotrichaceae bacterium IS1]|nr:MAG: hypothetical protein BWK78_04750 [Thiotrichaceae bacterium IS1]